MSRLSCGKVLFNEDIKNQKYEFTIDCIADTFVYNSNIVDGKVNNNILDFSVETLILPYKSRRIYEIKEPLSDDDKDLLIKVFITFGGCDEVLLRDKLNEFTLLRELSLFNEIPKAAITDFFINSFDNKMFNENEIFGFIQDIYINENSVSFEVPVEKPTVVRKRTKSPKSETISTEILKDVSSTEGTFAYKEYSVLIELIKDMSIKDVCVLSLKDNSPIKGTFKKITDRLYSFSFIGVPSDIKITVNCKV